MDQALSELAVRLLPLPGGAVWAWMDTRSAEGVYVVLVVLWTLWKRPWKHLFVGLLAVAVADPLASRALKPLFDRERPCLVDEVVRQAQGTEGVECRTSASLPSSHAANAAAVGAALASAPLAAGALLVGASRVVDGQHYPSDVLAGWMLGAAVGAGVRRLTRRLVATPPAAV